MASISVFKTQIKIFEKKFLSDRNHDNIVLNTGQVVKNANTVFSQNGNVNVTSELPSSNHSTAQVVTAAGLRKELSSNIRRIDLLTDSKIGDIKNIMHELADQIINLSKRVMVAEND